MHLTLLPSHAVASNTISAVQNPPAVSEAQLREALRKEHGFVVAGGQGELKGKIFRVGHMGFAQTRELASLVATLEELLSKAGHPLTPGAGTGAFFKMLR
jgi:aspartate aminotransferase-like enzyme